MIPRDSRLPGLRVGPGTVLRLTGDDYAYGIGPLVLLVTRVVEKLRLVDGEWLAMWGVPVKADGTRGAECYIWASVPAIRAQLVQKQVDRKGAS